MTYWKLPEGPAPITDAELPSLTRRLVGTSIDYKERYDELHARYERLRELYEATSQDAKEAEAYAEALEAKLYDIAQAELKG